MNENFIVETNTENGFIKVECADGHYITNWNKEDIMDYTDAKVMYCPLGYDLEKFYCVTEEEHNALMEEQLAKIKQLEAEKNNIN